MPLKLLLTVTEKTQIVSKHAEGLSLGELVKKFDWDMRTLKSYIENPITKPRQDKGTRKIVSQHDIQKDLSSMCCHI